MLSEKIKTLRKQARMTQEQLAARLDVSRQAVTKWETDGGVPDVQNLRALAALFRISIDDLLEPQASVLPQPDFLFDSVTEYDIDGEKRYDITLTGSKRTTVRGYEGEKLRVRLASQHISEIRSAFKVKIDDARKKIDVEVRRMDSITETRAKEDLSIFIHLPRQYTKNMELTGNMDRLDVQDIELKHMEFSGKAKQVFLSHVSGHVELDVDEDMDIRCASWQGRLDINQIAATSKLTLPAHTAFCAVTRGVANRILYERDGKPVEDFSPKDNGTTTCDNVIELNGMKSELIIRADSIPSPQPDA